MRRGKRGEMKRVEGGGPRTGYWHDWRVSPDSRGRVKGRCKALIKHQQSTGRAGMPPASRNLTLRRSDLLLPVLPFNCLMS